MKSLATKVSVKGQDASRLELLVRIPYVFILCIVLSIFSCLAIIAWVVNIFSVLIRGLRSVQLTAFTAKYCDYRYKVTAYAMLVTDERPPLFPE